MADQSKPFENTRQNPLNRECLLSLRALYEFISLICAPKENTQNQNANSEVTALLNSLKSNKVLKQYLLTACANALVTMTSATFVSSENENVDANLRLVSQFAPSVFNEFLASWRNEIQSSDKKRQTKANVTSVFDVFPSVSRILLRANGESFASYQVS